MCFQCWEEAGSPTIDTPAVRELAALFAGMDHYGPLHIIVDDWNVADDDIEFCATYTRNRPLTDDETAAIRLMRGMSKAERASALARADGFWDSADLKKWPD